MIFSCGVYFSGFGSCAWYYLRPLNYSTEVVLLTLLVRVIFSSLTLILNVDEGYILQNVVQKFYCLLSFDINGGFFYSIQWFFLVGFSNSLTHFQNFYVCSGMSFSYYRSNIFSYWFQFIDQVMISNSSHRAVVVDFSKFVVLLGRQLRSYNLYFMRQCYFVYFKLLVLFHF